MNAILLLLTLCLAPPAAPQAKDVPDLPLGLTFEQVRERLGPPTRVGRQLLAHRAVEQWHYDAPSNLRLTFDCPRGQTPRLVRKAPARRDES